MQQVRVKIPLIVWMTQATDLAVNVPMPQRAFVERREALGL
jgi:hypothetical protein